MNLLINALQVEVDPQNTHMLLGNNLDNTMSSWTSFCSLLLIPGGLLLSVQDSAAAEEAEQVTQPDSTISNETTTNLLSSGKFLQFHWKFDKSSHFIHSADFPFLSSCEFFWKA